MPKFTFHAQLVAEVLVTADNAADAAALLSTHLGSASANLGAWPNGDPIIGQVTMDNNPQLVAIDGELV